MAPLFQIFLGCHALFVCACLLLNFAEATRLSPRQRRPGRGRGRWLR